MAIIHQPGLFSWDPVDAASDLDRLRRVLEALPDEALMVALEAERKGKRDDYPLRAVWNSLIAGVVFQHNGVESLRRELLRNAELRQVCGFDPLLGMRAVPGPWVYTRLFQKLIAHQADVDAMFDRLVERLHVLLPDATRMRIGGPRPIAVCAKMAPRGRRSNTGSAIRFTSSSMPYTNSPWVTWSPKPVPTIVRICCPSWKPWPQTIPMWPNRPKRWRPTWPMTRKTTFVDPQMTVLRIDKADGAPYAVLVNYTAHGTFVDDTEMMLSSEWAGSMQRTVEDMIGHGVVCLYTNGAEGDQSPTGGAGGSNYEKAWNYGRKVGIAASRLAEAIETADLSCCAIQSAWVTLPPRRPSPDFQKIAGQEYKVSQEELEQMVQVLFPEKAPIYALRVNEFLMMTFPGEPICEIGLAVKASLRKAGIANPCVASLTTDHIGYILTKDEYNKSGYEATASFYGDGLGQLMQDEVCKLGAAVAGQK